MAEDTPVDEGPEEEEPGGSERVYPSLDAMLQQRRIPMENHATIRQVMQHLGITRFTERASYAKAHRPDGGPVIRVASGWVGGFTSREEAEAAAGDRPYRDVWPSGRKNLWGMTLPASGGSSTTGLRRKRDERDYGTCPTCTMKFTPAGTCLC